jgi:hypothetical protein
MRSNKHLERRNCYRDKRRMGEERHEPAPAKNSETEL